MYPDIRYNTYNNTLGYRRAEMPIYEYSCSGCGDKFELRRNFGEDDSDIKCPKCGKKNPKRILSAFSSKASSDSCAPSSHG
jgi:putative FmdB family regulatory protein